ncbi:MULTISPECIES: hypothetical protein [Pandoraea]|uniref:Uncharacterized protein n=1 Tax=Pandoraea cepalis TaxID=2508294 RepID=A0A5E4VNG0_9BURK|nr:MULTISPECIES: hypothetical protein [Pandoraea]QBC31024.1 hypothetical protein DRB87_06125 [Pandoraea sp. XY-2]VVE12545.1 hypothetical protein PCE31107_02718 [Pandoraea cepalis]
MSDSNRTSGKDEGSGGQGDDRLDLPKSLTREGHVVWFHEYKKYLGYAWDESAGEIRRAHVSDPEHAIYFETFAEAMVATDRLMGPHVIIRAAKRGDKPRLLR